MYNTTLCAWQISLITSFKLTVCIVKQCGTMWNHVCQQQSIWIWLRSAAVSSSVALCCARMSWWNTLRARPHFMDRFFGAAFGHILIWAFWCEPVCCADIHSGPCPRCSLGSTVWGGKREKTKQTFLSAICNSTSFFPDTRCVYLLT